MVYIYTGDFSLVDAEVLEAVKALPDEFFVFAEFIIDGRNIDWFIVRTGAVSTLILTELKRESHLLEGEINSPWRKQIGQEWEAIPPNERDINYYWQAVHTANDLQLWLWNHQSRYREGGDIRTQDEFGIWPDLLILSPPLLIHRLPVRPTSGYGLWFFRIDRWMQHLASWDPTRRREPTIGLSKQEVENLASALHLQRIWPEAVALQTDTEGEDETLLSFIAWLRGLDERLTRVEHRLKALEEK